MTRTIKLTSKRQATFPVEVCEALHVGPGDEIELVPQVEDGEQVWLLRSKMAPKRPWLELLHAYANQVEDHGIEAVRHSIAKGRKAK